MSSMQVVAIILAAGKSSRMGVNKLLLEIDRWSEHDKEGYMAEFGG